jgi:hypothetical protein
MAKTVGQNRENSVDGDENSCHHFRLIKSIVFLQINIGASDKSR